jgi:hypothetical protein
VLATLGRTADLVGTGAIDRMLRSAARLSKLAIAVTASNSDSATLTDRRHIGLRLVFERLWRDAGCEQAFGALRARYALSPDIERIAWLQALEHQIGRRHDPARDDAEVVGRIRADATDVERVAELLESEKSDDSSCRLQEEIEEAIFFQRPRRPSGFTLVLVREEAERHANRPGRVVELTTKVARPWRERPHAVAAAVIDGNGRIVCCDAWTGDGFTGAELRRVIVRLQTRFAPEWIAVAADPEVIDGDALSILDDGAGRLRLGPHPVLGPTCRRHAAIDPAPVFDGTLELSRTAGDNSDATDPFTRARCRVREAFRPILRRFEQQDCGDRSGVEIRSRIFFASLGLRMRHEFESRLATSGHVLSWGALIDELQQMLEFEFEHANGRYVLRTPLSNRAKLVFASLGIAPLPLIEPMVTKTTS